MLGRIEDVILMANSATQAAGGHSARDDVGSHTGIRPKIAFVNRIEDVTRHQSAIEAGAVKGRLQPFGEFRFEPYLHLAPLVVIARTHQKDVRVRKRPRF